MGSQLTLVGFSAGGHLHGQLLILKGRSWHSPKSAIDSIALANFTSLDRFLLVGGPDSFCHPPTLPWQMRYCTSAPA